MENEADLEYIFCQLCECRGSRFFMNRLDRFSGEVFQYQQCSKCNLIYLNPRPTQIEIITYYPDNYEAYQAIENSKSSVQQWHLRRLLNSKMDLIKRFTNQPGYLLDVGCATGDFIKSAQEQGWKVKGIELVEKAAQIAQEQYNLDVSIGSLETVHLQEKLFDVITLWDVLEHIHHPRESLQIIYRLLKPGGLLIFSVPNLNSFDRYFFGTAWIGWDAPRHLQLFTDKNLRQLLTMNGYKLLQQICFSGGKGTFSLSLEHALAGYLPPSLIRRADSILSYGLWPYRQIAYSLNRGPIITYVGRKELSVNS